MEIADHAKRRVGECLEIGVAAGRDYLIPSSSLLVEVSLENRCHEPTLVDLAQLRMWAERLNGERYSLVLYDPRKEVVALHLQPEAKAVERFRVDEAGEPGALGQACFDPTFVGGETTRLAGVVCYRFDHEATELGARDDAEARE
jgi:hypothetical protein